MRFAATEIAARQSGVVLIEALVAILIFSIGVVALMGVQAASVRSVSDSKLRLDAEFFVDQLVSDMMVDARNGTPQIDVVRLQDRYGSTSGGGYLRWFNRVRDVANGGLPGANTDPPVIVVSAAGTPAVPAASVFITVFWRAPTDDPAAPPRRIVTTTIITQ